MKSREEVLPKEVKDRKEVKDPEKITYSIYELETKADALKEADEFVDICGIPAQLINVNVKYVLSGFSRSPFDTVRS